MICAFILGVVEQFFGNYLIGENILNSLWFAGLMDRPLKTILPDTKPPCTITAFHFNRPV